MQVSIRLTRLGLLAWCFTLASYASQTRTWTEGDYSDFEKGHLQGLSLRSDGVLSLAPQFRELFDSSSAYLWTLAVDSKGNLYTGGGPGAKLYRISPSGEKKMLAELDGLEIHAVAVDRNDRVYAATSPDGKVYRISSGGKAEVFYDPKSKYIWALAFDRQGNLFVATGDQGEIHRVGRDGKGSVFFKTDETHARSMVLDRNDNLIVGTDPGGLVMRISPSGLGFVLYQMSKKEVTAVAAAPDGTIYASGVGTKQPSSFTPVAVAPAPAPVTPSTTAGTTITLRPSSSPPPSLGTGGAVSVSGGSELYRFDPAGTPLKLWTNSQDIIYAIALDAKGRPLLGSGNKGYIYRVDSDSLYTALLTAPATQITAMLAAPDGRIYAATGNVGKVYQAGPALENRGSIESDVFDGAVFSLWGRLSFEGKRNGGEISIVARSGNLDQPQKNWSPWSAPVTDPKGARMNTPPARFAQWKATLTAGGSQSPELTQVDFAYLPKNVRPRIEEVEITPANYRFPAPAVVLTPSQTLSLPPLGKRPRSVSSVTSTDGTTPAMQYAKGYMGARWAAADEDGDSLVYRVEIRGVKEREWKLLKDNIKEKYLSWDSTPFPDGDYQVRVTASDLPSNPPQEALTVSADSDPFLIDNTPPQITGLTASHGSANLTVRWKATDALSNVKQAEYSLDGHDWTMAAPVTKLSDSQELDYELTLQDVAAGEHTIAVRVEDEYDNQATAKVVVRP